MFFCSHLNFCKHTLETNISAMGSSDGPGQIKLTIGGCRYSVQLVSIWTGYVLTALSYLLFVMKRSYGIQWSARLPSISMVQVRIPLKFPLKFCKNIVEWSSVYAQTTAYSADLLPHFWSVGQQSIIQMIQLWCHWEIANAQINKHFFHCYNKHLKWGMW